MATWLATCCLLLLLSSFTGGSRARYRLSVLRMLIVAGLLLALWTPWRPAFTKGKDVVMVGDVSQSVVAVYKQNNSDCLQFYRQQAQSLAKSLGLHDRLAVVLFAADAEIIASFGAHHKLSTNWFSPQAGKQASRLDKGLQLAANLLADSGNGEVHIYSDGQLSPAIIAECARLSQAAHFAVKISPAFPPHFPKVADASIEMLQLPLSAARNSQISGEVVCHASQPGDFRVRLYCLGALCHEQTVRLQRSGSFHIGFGLAVTAERTALVEAVVESLTFADCFPANDRMAMQLHVDGDVRVLWLGTSLPAWASLFDCRLASAVEAGLYLADLDSYQALVIADGNLSLASSHGEKILSYVRSGGGLLVCGSAKTLGPGAYAGTPLEQALPVWCTPRQDGGTYLCILLDVSGSMAENNGGITKIDAAKQAVCRLLQQLPEDAWATLLTFRDVARVEIPWTQVKHLANDRKLLDNIIAHGSTRLVPALQLALDSMSQKAGSRHVVLISDGLAADTVEKVLALAATIGDKRMAVAIFSTGGDASGLLRQLARTCKGTYQEVNGVDLEQSLRQQWQSWQGSLLAAGPTSVHAVPGPLWQNDVAGSGLYVERWVRVACKPWGVVAAATEQQYPLLVAGFCGIGRSAVLTTNFAADWGGSWMQQQGATVGVEIISWLAQPQRLRLPITGRSGESGLEIQVDMRGKELAPIHNEALRVWHADSGVALDLTESAAGQYRAIVPTELCNGSRLALQQNRQGDWVTIAVWAANRLPANEMRRLGWRPLDLPQQGRPRLVHVQGQNLWWLIAIVTLVFVVESWIRLVAVKK